MKKLAAVMAVAVFASGAASASDKTDAMAVVVKWVDAFNKGDGKTGSSYCADAASIIDDFAPHVWQGSGACASWYKDYAAFAAKAQITDASVALGKARHFDIDSGYAYLVTPTTLTYTKAGKPVTDKALVTMSLKKVVPDGRSLVGHGRTSSDTSQFTVTVHRGFRAEKIKSRDLL